MRTNIDIDDKLMAQALKLTGLSTKRAVVEEGLRLLVRVRKQAQALKTLRGLGREICASPLSDHPPFTYSGLGPLNPSAYYRLCH